MKTNLDNCFYSLGNRQKELNNSTSKYDSSLQFVIKILLFANIIMYLQLQSFNRLFLKHRETLIHGTL